MNTIKILNRLLLLITIAFGNASLALAFERVGQNPTVQNSSSVSNLSGDFISLKDKVLLTSVGSYQLYDGLAVVDLDNLQNRDYSSEEKRPKVALTFNNKQLIKVIIYE